MRKIKIGIIISLIAFLLLIGIVHKNHVQHSEEEVFSWLPGHSSILATSLISHVNAGNLNSEFIRDGGSRYPIVDTDANGKIIGSTLVTPNFSYVIRFKNPEMPNPLEQEVIFPSVELCNKAPDHMMSVDYDRSRCDQKILGITQN